MDTYLLTWKPSEWSYDKLSKYLRDYAAGSKSLRWSCGTTKHIPVGSRVFLTKQGKGERGVFGAGVTVSAPYSSPHYNEEAHAQGKSARYVDVRFSALLDPMLGIPMDIERLREIHPTIWDARGSGKRVPPDAAAELSRLWDERIGAATPYYADDLEDGDSYYEGAKKTVTVNTYERDPEVRRRCIAKWGTSCAVCGFSFEYKYGPIGKNYIHVHHLKPLSEIGEKYQVDPVNDLRPVCPNCHSMLHRKKPTMLIRELKDIIALYDRSSKS